MTGMLDDTSDVDQTSTKATWRDRVRNARGGEAGMLWKYAPKQLKDEEVSRPGLQTPMLAISVPSSLSNPQFIVLGTSSGFASPFARIRVECESSRVQYRRVKIESDSNVLE
jgi:hypothetical protein